MSRIKHYFLSFYFFNILLFPVEGRAQLPEGLSGQDPAQQLPGQGAPGQGTRAPGQGARAPGQGTRAPGEGTRAAGQRCLMAHGQRLHLFTPQVR